MFASLMNEITIGNFSFKKNAVKSFATTKNNNKNSKAAFLFASEYYFPHKGSYREAQPERVLCQAGRVWFSRA